jgi:hypothetical protein
VIYVNDVPGVGNKIALLLDTATIVSLAEGAVVVDCAPSPVVAAPILIGEAMDEQ